VKTALDFANKFAGGDGLEPVFAVGWLVLVLFFDVQACKISNPMYIFCLCHHVLDGFCELHNFQGVLKNGSPET